MAHDNYSSFAPTTKNCPKMIEG